MNEITSIKQDLNSEVVQLLEHFGIYERFECIKCKNVFGNMNLAMAHLQGRYMPCRGPGKAEIKKIKVPTSGRKVKQTFSEDDKHYIMTSGKTPAQLAVKFHTTGKLISKVKYRWKLEKKKKGIKTSYNNSLYKKNKFVPSNDYKVAPAEQQ